METDLGEFLAPAGSALGEVTQRVLAYLSVQDLIEYVAVASSQPHNTTVDSESTEDSVAALRGGDNSSCKRNGDTIGRRRIPSSASCVTKEAAARNQSNFPRCGKTFSSRTGVRLATEVEIPHNPATESGHGGGDEAGGSSREAITQRTRDPGLPDAWENINGNEREGVRWCEGSRLNQERRNNEFAPESGLGIQAFVVEDCGVQGHQGTAVMEDNKRAEMATQCKGKEDQGTNILGILIGLGMKPLAAFGAMKNSLTHVVGRVPLLALLQWAAEASSSILGVTFHIALMPYDVSRGVVMYVMGAVEAMLNVAKEIWGELRHLNLGELAMVVSCVLSGNALPEFLLNPPGGGPTAKDGSITKGTEATLRVMSRFSRRGSKGSTNGGGSNESSEGHGLAEDSFPGRNRSQGPSGSDGTTWRPCVDADSAVKGWREAHAMRRRFDRVNCAASLVSYQEGSESGVSRAKAQRVRQHMHYAMSLQCFQATVTKCSRDSPANSNGRRDDDELDDLDDDCGTAAEAESREGSSIYTPQSFPPTPNSRAHVMAHTSRFADDVVFLARDQLRLRENLKPGVDETTRATANFLRRQRRLAVLDGGIIGEGIVLTCGHHRATKIGPSLYSSARAMVPVLRNRYVYFQVSCEREGSSPSVGVGLSTPEMPLSTLVGAFSNSVGLCSTGQVLMSSRWYGVPGEYALRKTGPSTVGVLVYLDDSRFFRSWEGDMVRALVCFSVDGRLVHIATAYAPPMQLPSLLSAAVGTSLPRAGASPCYVPTAEDVVPWEHTAAAATASAANTPYAPVFHEHGAHIGKGKIGGITGAGFPDGMPGVPSFTQAGVSGRVGGVLGRPGDISPAPVAGGGPAASAAALGLALPDDRDLFPTVTIHSTNTEVLCRFCAEDLLPVSRESMGAPPGVPVYALDGSLINV